MLDFFSYRMVKLHGKLNFGIELARQLPNVPVHAHEFIELAFVSNGTGLHIYTGSDGRTRVENLLQGDLFVVQQGDTHSYEHCGNMVLYNVFIKPKLLNKYTMLHDLPGWEALFGRKKQTMHLSVSERTQVTMCLDHLLDEYVSMRPGSEAMCGALFTQLLVTSLRSEKSWRDDFSSSYDPGIIETLRLMEQNPANRFSLKSLANMAHKSVTSYTKKFRETTGLSPMEYLLKIRIQQALHYLHKGGHSMEEIAALCGFCSANYMIKLFHREIGITPAKYRKQKQDI